MANFFSPENENRNYGLAMGLLSGGGWSPTPQGFAPGMARGLAGYAQGKQLDQQAAEQRQWAEVAKQLGLEGVPASAVPGLVSKMLEAQYAPRQGSTDIQEYEYARQGGYKGSFYDWMNEKSRAAPYFQPLITSGGVYSFNARDKTIEPMRGPDGKPLLPLAGDPTVQGDVARAKAAGGVEGEAEGEKAKQAMNAPERERLYLLAEDMLDKSTGSGAGALADRAAAFFGKSTEGAEAADRLRIIGGTLTLKVPRMEGPQSNLDQQLYREVAGQIGDPTVPAERKRASIKTLRDLDKKYEHLNKAEAAPKAAGGFKVLRKIK